MGRGNELEAGVWDKTSSVSICHPANQVKFSVAGNISSSLEAEKKLGRQGRRSVLRVKYVDPGGAVTMETATQRNLAEQPPLHSAATDHNLPPSAGTREGQGHWAGQPQPGKFGASPSGGASTVLALLPKCPFWHFLPWGNWKGEEGGRVVCNNRVFAPTQPAPLPIPRHAWIC